MSIERLSEGIKPYINEQNELLEAIRNSPQCILNENRFDELLAPCWVKETQKLTLKFRPFDKGFIMGDFNGFGNLSKFIHLAQIMVQLSIIKTSTDKNGLVCYEEVI